MDRYICKAKDIKTGTWVYGYYVAVPEEYSGELVHAIFDPNESEHICMGEYMDCGWHEVNPDTICRYTGLNDKQGNPIFEGNIITTRYVDDGRLTKGMVNFLNGCFCVKYDNYNNPAIDMLYEYEISGNVFYNTELMEE